MQTSEVAQLRQQIEMELTSMRRGLSGFALGTARHTFIHTRMERVGAYQDILAQYLGEHEATEIVCGMYMHSMEQPQEIVGVDATALVETLNAMPDITRSDIIAVFRRFNNIEEVERFCHALQEAWQAVDLMREHCENEQTPVGLENMAAFAGVGLLKDRFGDETARKLVFAPSSAVREMQPS